MILLLSVPPILQLVLLFVIIIVLYGFLLVFFCICTALWPTSVVFKLCFINKHCIILYCIVKRVVHPKI